MFLMKHLCTLLYYRTQLQSRRAWIELWEQSALEHEGGCFLRGPRLPLTETGNHTMHEARLQRLPHSEVIEKLISVSVIDAAAEFLPDAGQAA